MSNSKEYDPASAFHNTGTPTDRESYQRWYESNSHFSINQHISAGYAFLHWLLPFVKGRVIDLGCQWGGVTKILCDLPSVTHVDAIDITDYHIERTREFVKSPKFGGVTKCYIEDIDTTTKYDSVVMTGVLEHVLDPIVVLCQCIKLLAPGGKAVVMVPDGESFPEPDHLRQYDHRLFYKEILAGAAMAGVTVTPHFASTHSPWNNIDHYSWLLSVIST